MCLSSVLEPVGDIDRAGLGPEVLSLEVPLMLEDLCTNSQDNIKMAGNHSVTTRPQKLKYKFGVSKKETTTMKTL